MGSCVYYLKAYGCKESDVEKIKSLLFELYEAENFWQDSRGIYEESKKLPQDVFWSEFENKFPNVSKYLKFIKKFGKDSNNALAGYLDFGTDDDIEDSLYITSNYTDKSGVDYGELRYSAEVWHMSDWTGFAKFLKKEFGLKRVNWVSEEDMNPFDLI